VDSTGSGYEPMVGICEQDNEHSAPTLAGNFLTSWITINFSRKTLHHGVG